MRADLANTGHSAHLDYKLKDIAKELEIDGFIYRRKLVHMYLDGVGCEPDGGLWFKDGYLEAAFEAKHQGPSGNAIERWYKNYWLIQNLYPQAKFITFCTGQGVAKRNGIWANFNMVLQIEGKPAESFNQIHNRGASFYMSEYGFSPAAMEEIMKAAITGDTPSSGIKL